MQPEKLEELYLRMAQRGQFSRAGYSTIYTALNGIFNVGLASILTVLALPLMAVIAVAVKLTDRGPVIYAGTRLGENKKPFTMYKFRTLVPDAHKIIGAEVLTRNYQLVTPIGHFLRSTHFDELPQLFNILLRDMDFFGPRPQRPEVVEKIGDAIRDYDKRFGAKPGLIGYPQLFLPHSASKKLQSRVDNRFLYLRQNFAWEIWIIIATIFLSLRTAARRFFGFVKNRIVLSMLMGRYQEKRESERLETSRAVVQFGAEGQELETMSFRGDLININDTAFLMHASGEIGDGPFVFRLQIPFKSGMSGTKTKVAWCRGTVYRKMEIPGETEKSAYVINYEAVSPLNYYMVNQYFLQQSMAI